MNKSYEVGTKGNANRKQTNGSLKKPLLNKQMLYNLYINK